jgi:carboxymethylenebutenolidase
VAIAPDLLSRQGGTSKFTDPAQQTQAYGRTTRDERYSDLIATLAYVKTLPVTRHDRVGVVGFCAGGGNAWDLAVNTPEIVAAVPYYGTPLPSAEALAGLNAAVLAIYAETDRALTARMAPVMTALLDQRKTFGFFVYAGVGHAFHNDTGPAYNAEAACDAWSRTVTWFNKHLRT